MNNNNNNATNLDNFERVENNSKDIKKFIRNKNMRTDIYRKKHAIQ